MIYIAVDKNKKAWIYSSKPIRNYRNDAWAPSHKCYQYMEVPYFFVKKLTGKELCWKDEPVKIKNEIKE